MTNKRGHEGSAANVYVKYRTRSCLNGKWRTLEVVMDPQQVWKVVGVILLVCGLQLYGQQTASGAATYTTFDPLGSVNGTQPLAINPAGAITGFYSDVNFVAHGFVRAPNGTLTTFDFPASAATPSTGTNPYTTNTATCVMNTAAARTVAEYYVDVSSAPRGFLRAPNGTLTTFDPPGSTTTIASGINPATTITGSFATNQYHGFLRASNGKFTTFDPPGSQG